MGLFLGESPNVWLFRSLLLVSQISWRRIYQPPSRREKIWPPAFWLLEGGRELWLQRDTCSTEHTQPCFTSETTPLISNGPGVPRFADPLLSPCWGIKPADICGGEWGQSRSNREGKEEIWRSASQIAFSCPSLFTHTHPPFQRSLELPVHERLEDFVGYMVLLLSFSCWQFKNWLFGGWLNQLPPTHVSGLCLEIPSLLWMKCSMSGEGLWERERKGILKCLEWIVLCSRSRGFGVGTNSLGLAV